MRTTKLIIALLAASFISTAVYAKCGGGMMDHATAKAKEVVSQETNATVQKAKTTVKTKAKEMVKGKCGVGKCG